MVLDFRVYQSIILRARETFQESMKPGAASSVHKESVAWLVHMLVDLEEQNWKQTWATTSRPIL